MKYNAVFFAVNEILNFYEFILSLYGALFVQKKIKLYIKDLKKNRLITFTSDLYKFKTLETQQKSTKIYNSVN